MPETHFRSDQGNPISDYQVREPNLEQRAQSDRLRAAVKKAGGARDVAALSGVPFGTLSNYLAGGGMKLVNAVALAKACRVSIEWLATGQDSPAAALPPPENPTPRDPTRKESLRTADSGRNDEPTRLFNTVHIDKLAEALETVLNQLAKNQVKRPWHQVLQAAILVYDLMQEPGDPEPTPKSNVSAAPEAEK